MSYRENAKQEELTVDKAIIFIIYRNDNEIIVCLFSDEPQTVKEYFTEGGRSVDDYDRELISGKSFAILSELRID